jgi:hypothetical protein
MNGGGGVAGPGPGAVDGSPRSGGGGGQSPPRVECTGRPRDKRAGLPRGDRARAGGRAQGMAGGQTPARWMAAREAGAGGEPAPEGERKGWRRARPRRGG